MAGYFKKRRKAGPSKNEQKIMRGNEAERQARMAGFLKDRFPGVQKLSVSLEFLTPQQQSFERKVLSFGPGDSCDFAVPCPGRCGVGAFDLATKISTVITAHEPLSEGTGTCQEPLFAGSPDICGFQLRCKIEASYNV